MDKYQEVLVNERSKFYVIAEDQNGDFYNNFLDKNIFIREFNEKLTDTKSKTYRKELKIDDSLEIKQLDDINIKKYFLFLYNKNFDSVKYTQHDKVIDAFTKKQDDITAYGVELDFDNKIENIIIEFKYNMADPLTVKIDFQEADKNAYFARIENARYENLVKKLSVSQSCGQDLVTIRFQNCCDNVKYTKISLFDDKKLLMGEFKVDEGMFYKSITNLAYGKYFYKVAQYNKNNNLIVETDFISFSLSAPYYGKPLVHN